MSDRSNPKPARQDAEAGFVLLEPVGPPPPTLRKRRDFLACAKAKKAHSRGFTLQARHRREGEAEGLRVGYTCSKKVGNAVARNRAKRRLREAARAVMPHQGQAGWDYVLIGRAEVTEKLPFHKLIKDLQASLHKIHGSCA